MLRRATSPLLPLLLFAASAAAQLANGGAESGSLAPWVPDLGGAPSGNPSIIKAVTSQAQTAPPVLPGAGGWFFSFATQPAGAPGSFVRLSQVAPLAAAPAVLALTGLVQTEFGDHGEARLELLDAGGGVLASATLAPLVSDLAWSPFFVDVAVPPAATQCRVRLTGTVQTGMAVNVFWDALALGASPWAQQGAGLPGTHGVPAIDGAGTLLPGEPLELSLEGAREQAAAWLVVGLSALQAPFKGGLLVPYPDLLVALDSGPAGALELASTWPAGVPSGFAAWFQWWIQDPAGPAGFAASAGLRGTTP